MNAIIILSSSMQNIHTSQCIVSNGGGVRKCVHGGKMNVSRVDTQSCDVHYVLMLTSTVTFLVCMFVCLTYTFQNKRIKKIH